MFDRTIDRKSTFIDEDGYDVVDLGSRIFSTDDILTGIPINVYRIGDNMNMRSDLLSYAAYAKDSYTEMLLKYNNIQNPFTVQFGDILIVPSVNNIFDHVTSPANTNTEKDEDKLIREFHKYIDKDLKPNTRGSEELSMNIPKSSTTKLDELKKMNSTSRYKEPEIADEGTSSIQLRNGKIYFGANTNIKCAGDGITASEFIQSNIKNNI